MSKSINFKVDWSKIKEKKYKLPLSGIKKESSLWTLINQWIEEEIKMENRKYFELMIMKRWDIKLVNYS